MCSSVSTPRYPGKEEAWKGGMYYDPEANITSENTHYIWYRELRAKMNELVDLEEKILNVATYKVPLYKWQWTNVFLNHQFVIFETGSYWWSVEKNSEGMTLQRSKKRDAVLRRYRQEPRIMGTYWDVQQVGKKYMGKITLGDLIFWLWDNNQLTKMYDPVLFNCQTFASHVVQEITQTMSLVGKELWKVVDYYTGNSEK